VLGSTQQLAGAAGVAAFVALMSAESARLAGSGSVPLEALAGGIRAAFLLGAITSLGAVACAPFVRRPDAAGPPPPH
jgi:DHA2 family lincomycin resistance protein-like MFS transporter